MSGLICREVEYNITKKSDIFRLESEYYNSEKTEFVNYRTGEEITDFVQYGTSKALNEEKLGYPVLRLNEFDGHFIDKPHKYCNMISLEDYEKLRLKKGDVLICRTNGNAKYVGKAALVTEDSEYAFASYLYRIRPKKELISSAMLVSFLNSKYGRQEIEKQSMQSNQVNFSPAKFREIKIPIFSGPLNQEIDKIYYVSRQMVMESKKLYNDSEKLLLEKLGVLDYKESQESIAVKKLSESFMENGRLDAEYYQPKYDEFEKLIYKKRVVSLNIYDKNYVPQDDKKYKYIELANIRENGIIDDVETYEGIDLPTRARRKIKEGQVLVSSIEGSLSSCALVTKDFNGAICTNGFYVVDADEINSETLLVLIKSWLIQEVLKRECSGTILTSINKADFSRIRLPMVDVVTQKDIKKMIVESYNLRQRSKILLEKATKSVEIAIECGEKTAIEFLKEEKV